MDSNTKLLEIFDKIQNGNQLTQFQSITRLNDYIKEQQGSLSSLNETKIFEKLNESIIKLESINTCITLVNLIIENCNQGVFKYEFVVNNFLSSINSDIKNSKCCLRGITDLLLSNDVIKYYLRNPTHPYIVLLRNTNKYELSNVKFSVLNEIYYVFDHIGNVNTALTSLKPVFLYAFLEKGLFKHLVARFFIDLLKNEYNQGILNYIYLYITHLQDDELKCEYFYQCLNSLFDYFESYNNDLVNIEKMIRKITDLIVVLERDHLKDSSKYWTRFRRVFEKNENLKTLIKDGRLFEIFASYLVNTNLYSLSSYLDLIEFCISKYEQPSNIPLAIFLPPLFYHSTCFSVNEHYFAQHKNSILKLTKTINDKLQGKKLVYPETCADTIVFNLVNYINGDSIDYVKLNRLAAHFILNDNDLSLIQNIVRLINEIVREWPHLSVMFISLYLYKLRISSNDQVLRLVFQSFSDLLVDKNDLNLFLRIYQSILDSNGVKNQNENLNDLQIVSVQQLLKLFTLPAYEKPAYSFIFDYLIKKHVKETNLYNKYTQAYCIHKIITHKPDYYASQLLSIMSNLLNECNSDETSGVCALLIDTLGFLCKNENVNMKSTWLAMNQKFRVEKRSLVIDAYCRFMANAAYLSLVESLFIDEILKILWNFDIENTQKTNSCLKALSKFNVALFKCSFLPTQLQHSVREKYRKQFEAEDNKEKTIDEIVTAVPGSCYMDLFESVKPDSFDGYSALMTQLLTNELELMPKRVFYLNRERLLTNEKNVEKHKQIFECLKDYLSAECRNVLKDSGVKSVDATYMLYAYDAPGDKTRDGKPTRRHKIMFWRNYEQTLTYLLTKGEFELNESTLNVLADGWISFMKDAFEGCIQALNTESQLELDENPQWNQNEVEKVNNKMKIAWIIARSKLLNILMTSYNATSRRTNTPNILTLALIGLINVSSTYCIDKNDQESNVNQIKWLEILVDTSLRIYEHSSINIKSNITEEQELLLTNDNLKFLQNLFENTNLFSFYLSHTALFAIKFQLSGYLVDFIHKCQIECLTFKTSQYTGLSFSIYINSIINSTKEFSFKLNDHINDLIERFYQFYLNSNKCTEFLVGLTKTLCCLYDEDSAFYDEKMFLQKILSLFDVELGCDDENLLLCEIILSCIAYKSNLIENERIMVVYKKLKKTNNYEYLTAFFYRFLCLFGYVDSVEWINENFMKWMKIMNSSQGSVDQTVMANHIRGLLTLIGGTSVKIASIFKRPISLSGDLEKCLKPNQTLKQILKANETKLESNLKNKIILEISLINGLQESDLSDNYFSVPNNYDYLDDASVLRETVNALIELSKQKVDHEATRTKFTLLVNVLSKSCDKCTTHLLPPINWYYFASLLLKSVYGKYVEVELIKITIHLIATLNSAFSLIKNFLIDTNYFYHLTAGSQLHILDNLKIISKRFDARLNNVFLGKLQIFLNFKHENLNGILFALYNGLLDCFQAKKEINVEVLNELKVFLKNLFFQFELNVELNEHVKILDLMCSILITINEDTLIDEVLKLTTVDSFMANAYLRFKLVSESNQSIVFVNDLFEFAINNCKEISEINKQLFYSLFFNCLLNSKKNAFKSQNSNQIGILKNSLLNWLIEYISYIKALLNYETKHPSESISLALNIFTIFINCANTNRQVLNEAKLDKNLFTMCNAELSTALEYLLQINPWKGINVKIFDFMIAICCSENVQSEFKNIFKDCLSKLQYTIETSSTIWYKYVQLMDKSNAVKDT